MTDAGPVRQSISVSSKVRHFVGVRRAHLHRALFNVAAGLKARRSLATGISCLLILVLAALFVPRLAALGQGLLNSPERVSTLQNALLALGSALVGATVITFSFVMFALQVNVERMPYGLFQRLSSDAKLLTSFLIAFLLALGIVAASLPGTAAVLSWSCVGAIMATTLIVVLVLYSYSRALRLINPIQQLRFVLAHSRRDLARWARRATVMAPLLPLPESSTTATNRSSIDLQRLAFFQANPAWMQPTKQAINHAMALARYYAERGDTEISGAALNTIVSINQLYIEAKGKTFFGANPLVPNPFSSDGFLTDTLEHLRQNAQIGISGGDEQQIEQTLRALGNLAKIYSAIEYGFPESSKHHAHLALGYLAGAVKAVIPHSMPDVLMEGVRVMGGAGMHLMAHDKESASIVTTIEDLATIGAVGIRDADHRPVTQTAVQQLAILTLFSIQTSEDRTCYAAKKAAEAVSSLAELFLQIPENVLQPITSQSMQHYFSTAMEDALPAWLGKTANALQNAKQDDPTAIRIVRNLELWFNQKYAPYRKLLQAAVSKRSHFAFDILHGIAQFTSVLMVVAHAPACDERARKSLLKHATWLLYGITWVPDDKESVAFAENFQITEVVFGIALEAERLSYPEIRDVALDVLLSWTMKAGKYETGWATLGRGLISSALVVLRDPAKDRDNFLSDIGARVAKAEITQELRERAVEALHETASEYHDHRYASSRIDHALGQADRPALRDLLNAIAERLVP